MAATASRNALSGHNGNGVGVLTAVAAGAAVGTGTAAGVHLARYNPDRPKLGREWDPDRSFGGAHGWDLSRIHTPSGP